MTFVLYPMFRFQEIIKDWNATKSFAFEDGIVRSMRIIKKRLLLRCIHHFKSDLIDNMDHK